jgi:hypothetical protein
MPYGATVDSGRLGEVCHGVLQSDLEFGVDSGEGAIVASGGSLAACAVSQ